MPHGIRLGVVISSGGTAFLRYGTNTANFYDWQTVGDQNDLRYQCICETIPASSISTGFSNSDLAEQDVGGSEYGAEGGNRSYGRV